ncbi:hypothetical protein TWF481_010114 [Arthrobotrys musiformis]|uniref:Glycosyltransferase family 71 protein n=1 Tax=Arthrobotrys musiformis TaxID=47236 RepID=A0AAV9VZS7_9PEZI
MASRTPLSYRDKDDFGRPKPLSLQSDNWRSAVRFRRKRRPLFVILAICTIGYLFLHSKWWNDGLLVADGPTSDHATTTTTPKDNKFSSAPQSHNAVQLDPLMKSTDPNASKFIYNGPIRFLGLYETLAKVQSFNTKLRNRHVVFVAANMNTASILAGVACEMSATRKNVVHLALVGRNELSIEFFRKANGMDSDGCGVIIHDGRPDYASVSTDERMGLSLRSALKYIREYISPTVFISDMDREDLWFQKAIVQKAKELSITHIKLPHDASTIPWFRKLDAVSLGAWEKPLVDIVIHADSHSGQLIRLLKSLKNADYFTAPLPRLYIDLDPDTDPTIREFVDGFSWPSKDRIFVRHRILPRSTSLDDHPTEFVESFYPNGKDSAVLFLSPNIELSPFYYHFLFYSTLEYKHSNAQFALDASLIYGISLDAPLSHVNGKRFDLSSIIPSSENGDPYLTPYLYAGPSTHATLFFGAHWRLLHLYIARRLDKSSTEGVNYLTPTILPRSVPQWNKHFIELLTAGGYLMLYPNFDPSDSLAVYHTEVESAVTATAEEKSIMRVNNIMNYLPNRVLPMWTSLPIIGMDGVKTDLDKLLDTAKAYKKQILKKCGGLKKDDGIEDSVDDLFCDGDEGVKEKQRLARLEAGREEKEEEKERANDEEAKRVKEEKERVVEAEKANREKERKRLEKVQEKLKSSDEGTKEEESDGGEEEVHQAIKLEKDSAKVPDGRPKVIPHKIVSLDDLDSVPVEVNGERINAKDT